MKLFMLVLHQIFIVVFNIIIWSIVILFEIYKIMLGDKKYIYKQYVMSKIFDRGGFDGITFKVLYSSPDYRKSFIKLASDKTINIKSASDLSILDAFSNFMPLTLEQAFICHFEPSWNSSKRVAYPFKRKSSTSGIEVIVKLVDKSETLVFHNQKDAAMNLGCGRSTICRLINTGYCYDSKKLGKVFIESKYKGKQDYNKLNISNPVSFTKEEFGMIENLNPNICYVVSKDLQTIIGEFTTFKELISYMDCKHKNPQNLANKKYLFLPGPNCQSEYKDQFYIFKIARLFDSNKVTKHRLKDISIMKIQDDGSFKEIVILQGLKNVVNYLETVEKEENVGIGDFFYKYANKDKVYRGKYKFKRSLEIK
uniref:Uncharacterized protein n=1 Tax=Malassezia slooffiae TaxID=76776 RepID=A0A2I6QD09_9BASI|nr:hypothetical protein [Malassezia slooffiae]